MVRAEFDRDAHDALGRLPALTVDRLPEASSVFRGGQLTHGTTDLARDYDPSVALSATYETSALPSEEQLQSDLKEMVRLYSILVARGGRDTFEDTTSEEAHRLRARPSSSAVVIANTGNSNGMQKRRRRQNASTATFANAADSILRPCMGGGRRLYRSTPPDAALRATRGRARLTDAKKDFAVLCANCHPFDRSYDDSWRTTPRNPSWHLRDGHVLG